MMKKLFYFFMLFFLFLFIFFKSNTWETYKTSYTKKGVPYTSIRHELHWDRFFDYIKNVPRTILDYLPIDK